MNPDQIIAQCVAAYIAAWLEADKSGLPQDDCTLVARLAYDASFQMLTVPDKPLTFNKNLNA